ncbi:NAD(P)-dependent oxidoreductase [Polaribacter sp. 20A6]|uniref:NAD-dependent epimerase/dehydratase family protein n=1 Tax=Polaribacter sp. 20A6 TaxID=2687289 RepID=UPI0013FD555A|nr:NAD-dependent epimerase/dehydratase family protein [Polaribacter sp. 20A6]
MRLLITGSNGFLGRSFVKAYKNKYDLVTLSRKNADICVDLTKDDVLEELVTDIVIHAAGKAHSVPKTIEEEKEFYDVNLEGTKRLINSLKGVKSFVFISSVAVYGLEKGIGIDESSPLSGNTPYAKSKILAEEMLIDWSKKKNVNLLILRLPLLASKNPPGNLGDMILAIKNKKYFSINSGKARRSVVLVDDIVDWLPNHFTSNGIYNLTDGDNPSFYDLEVLISKQLVVRRPFSIPLLVAKIIGFFGDILRLSIINSNRINKMTQDLTFSSEKAKDLLSWKPNLVKNNFRI